MKLRYLLSILLVIILFIVTAGCTQSQGQNESGQAPPETPIPVQKISTGETTPEELTKFVNYAVTYARENGKEKAVAAFNDPDGLFVQGDVYAGGMGLVAACDMAVCVDTAGFCLSEVKLGLIPATISPYVTRAMGARAAHRYFLTAERFGAFDALRIGFVHEVVATDQLDAKVDELLKALTSASPNAVRACKKLVMDVAEREINAGLIAATVQGIADIRASDEGKEGVQSFLQKRKPAWLLV